MCGSGTMRKSIQFSLKWCPICYDYAVEENTVLQNRWQGLVSKAAKWIYCGHEESTVENGFSFVWSYVFCSNLVCQ